MRGHKAVKGECSAGLIDRAPLGSGGNQFFAPALLGPKKGGGRYNGLTSSEQKGGSRGGEIFGAARLKSAEEHI